MIFYLMEYFVFVLNILKLDNLELLALAHAVILVVSQT